MRRFGGRVETFVTADRLKAFASELTAYPLPGHVTLDIRGPARVLLDCYPFDAQGHVRVDVELSSEALAVKTELTTTYASLER
jgi:hypothetical protein